MKIYDISFLYTYVGVEIRSGLDFTHNEIVPHLNNCGTCGLIGCSIEVFIKGRGNSKHDSAKSSCSNFPKNFSIHIAKKSSKYSPCTNHPVRCEVCNKCFWSYNMETHYKAEHVHLTIQNMFI